jgi:MYXO-CTERM domain-containing protein
MPRGRCSSLLIGTLTLGCALLLQTAPARADGAFPNSETIMTPDALPHEILLATNFGIVRSVDDGTTWTWACEQGNLNATFYQLGPPPLNRIFAVALDALTATTTHLAYSDDSACGWSTSGGMLDGTSVQDEFPDPTNANRVLAITGVTVDGGPSIIKVVESTDGGATFGTLRYTADPGDSITGLEIARSAPSTIYLTVKTAGPAFSPVLVQSTNGGMSWTRHDLSAMLAPGTKTIRLVAVDPTNPQKVFLRVGAGQDEGLAVTTDGGATVTTPLTFPGGIVTAYTRMASGTIIVGGAIGLDNVAFRSTDGGASFQQLPTPPQQLLALSSRGTTLYAVANNEVDMFAIGVSADEGMTWRQFLTYDQITAIAGCLHDQCQTDCLARAGMNQWSPDMCSAVAPGPADAGVDAGPPGGGTSPGCHCAAGPGTAPGAWWWAGAAILALTVRPRRRRRTRPSKS